MPEQVTVVRAHLVPRRAAGTRRAVRRSTASEEHVGQGVEKRRRKSRHRIGERRDVSGLAQSDVLVRVLEALCAQTVDDQV